MSVYEKGVELEKLVANLFKEKGYDIEHNVKLVGRSGVEHQIDVFVKYKAPLHISKIVVECKAHDEPIDKEAVLKLIHVVHDLGVDKGILVTTSYFTPDAILTARGYNIELWNGFKLKELLKEISPSKKSEEVTILTNMFYIEPFSSIRLTKIKGEVEGSADVFYPYYEFNIDASTYEIKGIFTKKVEERIVSATVTVDALTGGLCSYIPGTGVAEMLVLPTLSEEEKRVFQILLKQGFVTVPALASLLGCSTSKARNIIQGLTAKRVAVMFRSGQYMFYKLGIEIPAPETLKSISSVLNIKGGRPSRGILIKPEIRLESAEELVKILWRGTIKDYKVIYYPYRVYKVNEKGKKYAKVFDMVTGNIDERLSKTFTSVYMQLPF